MFTHSTNDVLARGIYVLFHNRHKEDCQHLACSPSHSMTVCHNNGGKTYHHGRKSFFRYPKTEIDRESQNSQSGVNTMPTTHKHKQSPGDSSFGQSDDRLSSVTYSCVDGWMDRWKTKPKASYFETRRSRIGGGGVVPFCGLCPFVRFG